MKINGRIIVLLVLLTTAFIRSDVDVPYLTGRVNDNAQILSEETAHALSVQLKDYEDRTTNQIVVLTVSSLNGVSIEEYAVRVFEDWKIGQAGKDNGILIVIAPNERRMRIEVGYGLEPVLTDGTAGQIIHSVMTPRFKTGDFDGGITAGALAVIEVLDGRGVTELAGNSTTGEVSDSLDGMAADLSIRDRILIGAFIFGIIGLFTFIGIVTPGSGWFLYFFLIPFWAMFPIIVIGTKGALTCLGIYVIGFPVAKLILRNTKWYRKAGKDLKTKGRASIGGFSFSSRSSGSSWSSGGSSFSGGGGSSGGGGASGSW